MMKQADRALGQETKEFPPFTRIDGAHDGGLLVICDHASNALPQAYGTLGLPQSQLERHIGYDIGAAGVTKEIARLLGAPALLANFSRLLIDSNRGEDDPTLIMRLSDGAVVPGNATCDEAERERRIATYYEPYHRAIDEAIDAGIAAGRPPAIMSIHTFTESWRGSPRPWHAGVLWDKDARLSVPLLRALQSEPDILADANVPYSGELEGDCLYRHGAQRGLAHALVEIRQDLVRDEKGQRAWGERLARILESLFSAPDARTTFNAICHFGSHTDKRTQEPVLEARAS
ncbi:MAG: N-formylglutamate amidohydrolase [Pseudomonadota bacterium]